MDSRDQRSGVNYLAMVLRKVTRAVQLAPFAYLAFFGLFLVCEFWIPESFVGLVDKCLYVSPAFIVVMLLASRLLKLCPWHRAACLIPGSTQLEDFVDSMLFQFTQSEIILINTTIGVLSLAFLYQATVHFRHGSRK